MHGLNINNQQSNVCICFGLGLFMGTLQFEATSIQCVSPRTHIHANVVSVSSMGGKKPCVTSFYLLLIVSLPFFP